MKRYASNSGRACWHYDKETCDRVHQPERHVPRSRGYVRYHGLDPCPYCHPHKETPRDDEWYDEDNLTLAKRVQYGVGD